MTIGAGGAASGAKEIAELRESLERRFRTMVAAVNVGERTLEILRPANSDDLISEADYVKDERLPYWADIWPSSFVLSARLAEMRGDGQCVLELGCGVGLVAAGAALGGFRVLATDYYEDALLFTTVNVWGNAAARVDTRHVDWRAFPRDIGRFDMVIASDVLYEHEYAPLLADAFRSTLVRGGTGLIADPGRIAAGEFVDECESRGLEVRKADRVPWTEGEIRQTIDIYEIRHGV